MPELPEVETTCRGIAPHLIGKKIDRLVINNASLRWPVPKTLKKILPDQIISSVTRRAKYLLIALDSGTLIVHLGMSGSLRLAPPDEARLKHDHVELYLDNGLCLRYCDPRRFGSWLWTTDDPDQHSLLINLGPEPLGKAFSAKYLLAQLQNRKQAIKTLIMDSHLVVGVGNIYANEALFMSGIHPQRSGSSITLAECTLLVSQIKKILTHAIRRGGTTLRNFVGGDGKPGYFAQELMVYGHGGEACKRCQATLLEIRLGQRTTVFCSTCQH